MKSVKTSTLEIFFTDEGQGSPVILLHGFPYDVHSYDEVKPRLLKEGLRVITPYLRGFGPTRFLSKETPRSGQQAAMGNDLREFLDALGLEKAILAGYDWGGTAACVAAALWPERAAGMVSVNGYKIQTIARALKTQSPEMEHRLWYQHYFQTARGLDGLTNKRAELCRLLWRLWSPTWKFDDATYERSAKSFEHPDFAEIVIHSYRHRFGLVAGDPALEPLEQRLALAPPISVPAIALEGSDDGVMPPTPASEQGKHFTGPFEHRVVQGAGHNIPQEAPEAFANAVLALRAT